MNEAREGAEGVIFDLRRHCLHDGPGIRTTVFLKGCPLSCPWCHNPEGLDASPRIMLRPERCLSCGACALACPERALGPEAAGACRACGSCARACPSGARELVGRRLSVAELCRLALADEAYYGTEGGITFSGGEPLAQPEFLLSALRALGRHGIHRAVDTSGHADISIVDQLIGHVDLWLYDLKYFSSEEHEKNTGVGNNIIHANMKTLAQAGQNIMFSFPIIPGWNDSAENLAGIAGLIASTIPAGRDSPYPVRLLPYHGSAEAKYQRLGLHYPCEGVQSPSAEAMQGVARLFASRGLSVQIGGLS